MLGFRYRLKSFILRWRISRRWSARPRVYWPIAAFDRTQGRADCEAPRTPRFRFRLGTLILVVILSALAMGLVRALWQSAQAEAVRLRELRALVQSLKAASDAETARLAAEVRIAAEETEKRRIVIEESQEGPESTLAILDQAIDASEALESLNQVDRPVLQPHLRREMRPPTRASGIK